MDEIAKSGEFTRDIRILPKPEVFDEQLRGRMLERVDEAKERLIKEIEKTNDGRCSVYVELHPDQYRSATKLLKKWARAFGYAMSFGPPNKENHNIVARIFPKKDVSMVKSFFGFIVTNREHMPTIATGIAFIAVMLWVVSSIVGG